MPRNAAQRCRLRVRGVLPALLDLRVARRLTIVGAREKEEAARLRPTELCFQTFQAFEFGPPDQAWSSCFSRYT